MSGYNIYEYLVRNFIKSFMHYFINQECQKQLWGFGCEIHQWIFSSLSFPYDHIRWDVNYLRGNWEWIAQKRPRFFANCEREIFTLFLLDFHSLVLKLKACCRRLHERVVDISRWEKIVYLQATLERFSIIYKALNGIRNSLEIWAHARVW